LGIGKGPDVAGVALMRLTPRKRKEGGTGLGQVHGGVGAIKAETPTDEESKGRTAAQNSGKLSAGTSRGDEKQNGRRRKKGEGSKIPSAVGAKW